MALTKIDDRGLTTPIDLLDDEKIRFGTTDNDLEIFHGSNISTIKDGKGDLRIMSDTIRIQRNAGGENYIYATEGGKTSLYYDGSEKFETTSGGVKVTGIIDAQEDVYLRDNKELHIGDDSDLQIYHDGSNSYLKNAGTGNIIFLSDDVQFKSDAGGNTGLTINTDGAVELYHNNSKKLETTASGLEVTGFIGAGTSSPNHMLHLHRSDSNNSYTQYTNSTTGSAAGDGVWLGMGGDEACYLWQNENNHMAFGTNNTERLRITAGGDVSITDGNLVVASGHGIDFYPHDTTQSSPGSDHNLLSDYERGTWTPADGSSGALTLSIGSASYCKVGDLVFINFYVSYPTNSDGATAYITGLPFTPKGAQNYSYLTGRIASLSNGVAVQVNAASASVHIYVGDSAYINSQLSGKYILVSGCYSTA